MSCAEMTIEFLAGTNFEEAVREAKHLAITLNLAYVKFKFNNTSVSVGQYCDVEESVLEYMNNRKKFMVI